MRNTELFALADQLKAKLNERRPLPKAVLENLHENLVLNWTYHSNAIEGNTLTLKETKVALEGITVGGKTLCEHFEAINHREAILFLEEQVQAKAPINEWLIKSLHQLVLKNIDNDNAGKYRTINVLISGAEHTPSEAMQVPEQMQQFIDWANNDALQLHPIEAAARIHGELVKIHPFTDGNGRTPRLLMNLVLMQAGFPATIITVEQRLEYYSALDQAHTTGNYQPFVALIAHAVIKGFEPYWWALGMKDEVQQLLQGNVCASSQPLTGQ